MSTSVKTMHAKFYQARVCQASPTHWCGWFGVAAAACRCCICSCGDTAPLTVGCFTRPLLLLLPFPLHRQCAVFRAKPDPYFLWCADVVGFRSKLVYLQMRECTVVHLYRQVPDRPGCFDWGSVISVQVSSGQSKACQSIQFRSSQVRLLELWSDWVGLGNVSSFQVPKKWNSRSNEGTNTHQLNTNKQAKTNTHKKNHVRTHTK